MAIKLKHPRKTRVVKGEKYALVFPQGAFTEQGAQDVKAAFAAEGVTVILVPYKNNSLAKPAIERL